MIPNTTARMVGIHSFATDMVARPFDITARLAMTLAAEAGLSSKRTSPTLLTSRILVMNAWRESGVHIIMSTISPSWLRQRLSWRSEEHTSELKSLMRRSYDVI